MNFRMWPAKVHHALLGPLETATLAHYEFEYGYFFLALLASIIQVKILLSSANKLSGDNTFKGRSFMNIKNDIGPRTDPCGTPLVTL